MSASVTLKGRLTKDPELRFTNAGKAVAAFTVVTSKRFKNKADEWEEQDTSFWDCTAFGEFAENIAESCEKGTSVIITGGMRQEKWVNKDGDNRTSWKVLVDDLAVSVKWKIVNVKSTVGASSFNSEPPF